MIDKVEDREQVLIDPISTDGEISRNGAVHCETTIHRIGRLLTQRRLVEYMRAVRLPIDNNPAIRARILGEIRRIGIDKLDAALTQAVRAREYCGFAQYKRGVAIEFGTGVTISYDDEGEEKVVMAPSERYFPQIHGRDPIVGTIVSIREELRVKNPKKWAERFVNFVVISSHRLPAGETRRFMSRYSRDALIVIAGMAAVPVIVTLASSLHPEYDISKEHKEQFDFSQYDKKEEA